MGEIILVASIGFMPYFCAIRFQSFGRGRDSGGRASVLRTAPGRFPICGRGMLGGGGGPGPKRGGWGGGGSLRPTTTFLTRGGGGGADLRPNAGVAQRDARSVAPSRFSHEVGAMRRKRTRRTVETNP